MNGYYRLQILLAKRIFLVFVLYFLSRLVFYLLNINHFTNLPFGEALKIFFFGMRFDISSIILFNSIFILLHVLPLGFYSHFQMSRSYQGFLKFIFVVINTVCLFTNLADVEFFKYINKRSTFFTLKLLTDKNINGDFYRMLPQYLFDFWHIVVLWILMIIVLIYFYPQYRQKKSKVEMTTYIRFAYHLQNKPKNQFNWLTYLIQAGVSILIILISIVGFRGGLQLKPIRIINAAQYTDSRNVPLVLNTPFTIFKSFGGKDLKYRKFYTDNQLDTIFNPVSKFKNDSTFRKLNVVVFILESFSKEYIGSLNNSKHYTPFFDTLAKHGLIFDNAFANGTQSIEAMPSIIAGIPSLIEEPYITSNYAPNKINSLANLLKPMGYYTSFYHGGTNGTMGFDQFAKIAGFDAYVGRKEYNNENDYDGNWGIYDEEFLQFFAQKLNEQKQPFASCLFTLSSHHPYSVPQKYKGKFYSDSLKIHESIGYSDYALMKFFETAKKMPWFKNTLFVLTADHTGQSGNPKYGTKAGCYRIPILYYRPADTLLTGINHNVTQQSDILPSIMNYLKYPESFVAFGKPVFDTTAVHFAINYASGMYQFFNGSYVMYFDGDDAVGLYNFAEDIYLKNNLLKSTPAIALPMEEKLKAIIQSYNNRLINNKLSLD